MFVCCFYGITLTLTYACMYDIYVYMIMGVHVLLNMVKLWLTTHPTNNNVNHHKCIDITVHHS